MRWWAFAGWKAEWWASWPTSPTPWAALWTTMRPTRSPDSSVSATALTFRWSRWSTCLRSCPARHRSTTASSGTGRRSSMPIRRRRCPRSRWSCVRLTAAPTSPWIPRRWGRISSMRGPSPRSRSWEPTVRSILPLSARSRMRRIRKPCGHSARLSMRNGS